MYILKAYVKKKHLIIGLPLILLVAYFIKNNTALKHINVNQTNFITNLCNYGGEKYKLNASNDKFSPEVKKCGEYFSVHPGRYTMDAPIVYVDSEGKIVAACGGMPNPEPVAPNPICNTPCDEQNLCIGVTLSCSEPSSDYSYESCLCENYVRTGDAEYLAKIVKTDLKDRCPAMRKYLE